MLNFFCGDHGGVFERKVPNYTAGFCLGGKLPTGHLAKMDDGSNGVCEERKKFRDFEMVWPGQARLACPGGKVVLRNGPIG